MNFITLATKQSTFKHGKIDFRVVFETASTPLIVKWSMAFSFFEISRGMLKKLDHFYSRFFFG